MIPQHNSSHAIPDTTTPVSSPVSSPPHLIAPAASRPASSLTVSPDGSARSTTPSYTLPARYLLAELAYLLAPSHRLIRSARCCLPRPTHAVAIHRIHLIGSSAHLPSRPASSFASRRASSLVSSRLTACPASRFALLHLIGLSFISLLIRLVHLIHLIHIIYLIGIVPLH